MYGIGILRVCGISLLMLSLQSANCGEAKPVPKKEGTAMQVDVRLKVDIQPKPDSLEISYEFVNPKDQPVLVFDRMWDREKKAIDPEWVNIEIRGTKALISRTLSKKPAGLHFDNPPVPYGREVAPGGTLTGKFSVALPLKERFGFYNFVRQSGEWKEIPVHEVAFALGWALKPTALPPAIQPVDVGEDKGMLLLPYEVVEPIQKLVISQPLRLTVSALAKR